VAIEIAEAVIGALKGELSATAVNAPMVAPEVIKQLTSKHSFLHQDKRNFTLDFSYLAELKPTVNYNSNSTSTPQCRFHINRV